MMSEETKRKQVNPSSERLEQILVDLTAAQVRYIVARQDVPTDKAAAKLISVSADTISRWKREGVPIDEAVHLIALDGLVTALHIRKRNLAKAMAVKVAGLNSDDEKVRQSVATEIVEWEMGKATQRKEHSGPDGGPIETKELGVHTDIERNRSIATLAQALRVMCNRENEDGPSVMDTAEPAAVVSSPDAGG